jgi:SAM-dependent methyltransferase
MFGKVTELALEYDPHRRSERAAPRRPAINSHALPAARCSAPTSRTSSHESEGAAITITLTQPYEDLRFMAPLSEQRAETLVKFLARDLRGVVLDIGCGWSELLLRVINRAPDAVGFGIDLDGEAIERARQLATQRGLKERITLVCGDAKTASPKEADALICIGASQIWGPPIEDNQPLDYASALMALRAKVSSGARVVYGEGIWSQPPTPRAVEPLAGRLDELVPLPELVDIAVAHGFMPVSVEEANIDEWDEFESGFGAHYARWLSEHGADDAGADEIRARAPAGTPSTASAIRR